MEQRERLFAGIETLFQIAAGKFGAGKGRHGKRASGVIAVEKRKGRLQHVAGFGVPALTHENKRQRIPERAFLVGRKVGVLPQKFPQRRFRLSVGKTPCRVEGGEKIFHQPSITLRARSSGSLTPI